MSVVMEITSEEEEADRYIEELLKELDGIERCFVIDDDMVELKRVQSLLNKKRSIDSPPLVESVPPPKKTCTRDPRLTKMETFSSHSSTAVLSPPKFADRVNLSRVDAPNAVIPGLGKVFDDLSNHLGDRSNVPSPNTKRKRDIFDEMNKVPALENGNVDFDSVEKGLEALKSVVKMNEQSKSLAMEKVRFEGTPVEELKAEPEITLPMQMKKCNDEPVDHTFRTETSVVGTSARPLVNVRDPRIRAVIKPENLDESVDSCSKSILTTNVAKSTEEQLVTNIPTTISDTCEKSAQSDECTNAITESSTSLVNAADENDVVQTSIPSLPSEVLSKIFTYLPSSGLNSVKQVCKLWYDASNVESILMCQKFLCCGIYETTSIGQTLAKSKGKYLNLEFDGVDFCGDRVMPWKEIGPKIRSLCFVNCILGPETMCDVIVHCTEMKHLSLSFQTPKLSTVNVLSLGLFKDLFKQDMKRRKLIALDIHARNSNSWWLTNAFLSNLFVIYPNISQLGFTHYALDPITEASDLWSNSTLTFSPIFDYISSRAQSMTKLDLDVSTKGPRTAFAWTTIIANVTFKRLRELVIDVDMQQLSSVAVIEFCVAQTELESISCKIKGSTNVFMSFFLLELLKKCPRLRELKVTIKDFFVSYEFFRALIFSKLKSLSIVSSNVVLPYQITTEPEWPINEHLRSLSLPLNPANSFKSLLFAIFRKLKSIEVGNLSDPQLKRIQDHQTDLVALKVSHIESGPANGFLATPFRIRNMENLQCLVLDTLDSEQPSFDLMFCELRLPKLKYLYIGFALSPTVRNDLISAIKNSTELEALRISCAFSKRSNWLQLNENWKKLRYLHIVDGKAQRFKTVEYLKYFTTSPNLQALVHEYQNVKQTGQKIEVVYYYDALDKQVKLKNSDAKYRITSGKDTPFLDWLLF